MRWGEKPYHSLDYHYKERFGTKVYKLSLNGGFTCPNRDGTLGTSGCIFCSAGGSGDFASSASLSIAKQVQSAKKLLEPKLKHKDSVKYIAYFQAFTNTYAPVSHLKQLYEEALSQEDVVGIAIGTRPDCLSDEVIALLASLAERTAVYVELGLQTIHETTADYIRRGYPLAVFEDAVKRLANKNIHVVAHLIAGLPGENREMFLSSVEFLNFLPIQGVKIAMLHILKGTDLAKAYKKAFPLYSLEEYCDIIATSVGKLRQDIVIHRLTGDGPKNLLIAPMWTADKRNVLNQITRYFKEQNIYQGMYWEDNVYADGYTNLI